MTHFLPKLFPLLTRSLLLMAAAGVVATSAREINAADPAPANQAPASAFPLAAFTSLGSSFARDSSLTGLGWNEAQVTAFLEGMRAALRGQGYPSSEIAQQLMNETGRRLQEIQAHQAQATGPMSAQVEQYMKQIRKDQKLQQLKSGLCYRLISSAGVGIRPRPQDTVVISFGGIAPDGTKPPQLDVKRARLKVADLLPGLREGVQMMTIDSQMELLLPPALSYGDGAWPEGVERGMPLVFWVALHEVINASP
jgi:FKBP-type peptidyl-prolyl cis-trans isomerase FkpA